MRRKPILLGLGVLLLLTAVAAGGLGLLASHEPAFFRNAAVPEGPERKRASAECLNALMALYQDIQGKPEWGAEITQHQLNSFLAEDFLYHHLNEMLPAGVSDPRVTIDRERVRLGFRYGTGRWSTLVSVEFNAWLASKEYNVIVLELLGLHAGALPISVQTFMDSLSEFAARVNQRHDRLLEVSWYRKDGHPVALLKLHPDQPRPMRQLKQLVLDEGRLILTGHYRPSTAARALPPSALVPAGN
ncbi:MAG TPA: hypothetical protein VFA26_11270 [Gemmataceae bacterium]|nr:hypothetical protein [Gemmataceae bacterium]